LEGEYLGPMSRTDRNTQTSGRTVANRTQEGAQGTATLQWAQIQRKLKSLLADLWWVKS